LQLTENVSSLVTAFNKINVSGGGEEAEDVTGGLHYAATKIQWRTDSAKQLIFIADAPSHGSAYHTGDVGDELQALLSGKGDGRTTQQLTLGGKAITHFGGEQVIQRLCKLGVNMVGLNLSGTRTKTMFDEFTRHSKAVAGDGRGTFTTSEKVTTTELVRTVITKVEETVEQVAIVVPISEHVVWDFRFTSRYCALGLWTHIVVCSRVVVSDPTPAVALKPACTSSK
jgi:hypothetical protein